MALKKTIRSGVQRQFDRRQRLTHDICVSSRKVYIRNFYKIDFSRFFKLSSKLIFICNTYVYTVIQNFVTSEQTTVVVLLLKRQNLKNIENMFLNIFKNLKLDFKVKLSKIIYMSFIRSIITHCIEV